MTGDVTAHGLHEPVSTMHELLLERFVIGGATRTCKQRGVAQPEWSQSERKITTWPHPWINKVSMWRRPFICEHICFCIIILYYITIYFTLQSTLYEHMLRENKPSKSTCFSNVKQPSRSTQCYYAAFSHRFSAAHWRNSYQVRSSPHFVRKRVFWIPTHPLPRLTTAAWASKHA